MKAYLSSIGIPQVEPLTDLLGKSSNVRVASVRTGWDPYPAERKAQWEADATAMFGRIGGDVTVLDFKDYQGQPDALRDKLGSMDLVWIHGGNSFVLSYWAAQCELRAVLDDLRANGLVYGGDSAGACLAGPDLHGIELADNADDAPEVVFDGLGLVDFSIVPHWGNEKFQPVLDKVMVETKKHSADVVTLGDMDCLVIRDGEVQRFPQGD